LNGLDDDLEDLDRAEPEEMVDGLEDETNEPDKLIIEDEPECKTPGEKIRSKLRGFLSPMESPRDFATLGQVLPRRAVCFYLF